jgi:hypothetical protein
LPLTLKEEYRLRVFESGALRKTLGLDREGVKENGES